MTVKYTNRNLWVIEVFERGKWGPSTPAYLEKSEAEKEARHWRRGKWPTGKKPKFRVVLYSAI